MAMDPQVPVQQSGMRKAPPYAAGSDGEVQAVFRRGNLRRSGWGRTARLLSGKLNEVLLDKLFMPDYALC